MSYQPRGISTPGSSRKRKEKEALYSATSAPFIASTTSISGAEPPPLTSNRLLAGYMAHEFLAKGTVFGRKFDPARAGAGIVPANYADLKRIRKSESESVSQLSEEAEPSGSYFEVANLVKSEGVHVAGVVNPTQLARWIQN